MNPHSAHTIPVGPAWSGHRVGFDYLRKDGRQFVAYYDSDRRITVAARRDGETVWEYVRPIGVPRTPTFNTYGPGQAPRTDIVGWDSHNYLRLALDRDGHIHLGGNMHVDPLVYFRSRAPYDIGTLERIDRMTGSDETSCTYPIFLEGPDGELVFRYRDGRSGAGRDLYNTYDPATRTWRRLMDTPLLDAGSAMNAYASVPFTGPDGFYHILWVWRDSGDCATNHDLSHMRSRDLLHWENAAGRSLDLPVGPDAPAVIDPVPPGGGLLNNRQWLGFDSHKRPTIAYTKHAPGGTTQAWTARFEDGGWHIRQASDWSWRWEFSGHGSLPNGEAILLDAPAPDGAGRIRLGYRHEAHGDGVLLLDEATLAPVGKEDRPPDLPPELAAPESGYPGMRVRWMDVRGEAPADQRLLLRWETLDAHRDHPRDEIPPPTDLRVHCIGIAPRSTG